MQSPTGDHSSAVSSPSESVDPQMARLRLLSEVAAELLSDHSPSRLVQAVYRKISDFLNCDLYAHFEFADGLLRLDSSDGLDESSKQLVSVLRPGEFLCGQVAATCIPVVESVVDFPERPNSEILRQLALRCYASFPLIANGQLIGVLSVASRRRDSFGPHDIEFLRTVTNYITLAVVRVRERQQLSHNEERYRALVDQFADAMFLFGEGGLIQDANRQAVEMLGYSREEMIGKNPMMFDRGVSSERFQSFLSTLNNGESIHFETEHVHKDGRVFSTEVRCRPFLVNDKPHAVASVSDISERKAAEKAILKHRRLLAEAEMLANVGSFEWRSDGSQLIWSDGMYPLFGLNHADGQPDLDAFFDLVHPADRQRINQALTDAVNHRSRFSFEARIVRKSDGIMRLFECHGRLSLADQDQIGTVTGICQDITERRKAATSLQDSEEQFRAFFESSNVGMSEWTEQGEFIRANRKCYEMLGFPRDEFLQLRSYDLIHPDDRPAVLEQIQKVRDGLLSEYSAQRRYLRRDGQILHAQIYVSVSKREAGRPVRLATVAIDLTALKALEEQVRQAQKMEAVGQLAGGIAHDLNNLLTVINGYPDLMLFQMSAGDPQRPLLEAIQTAGEKAARLTRQLLMFSRRAIAEPQVMNLNQIVQQSADMLQRLLSERVELITELDLELWNCRIDPGQMVQVIMNLVVNARDALPSGGQVIIRTENIPSSLSFAERTNHPEARSGHLLADKPNGASAFTEHFSGMIRLSVTDNGTGIEPSLQTRIFEPFFTTKAVGKGTGLGLSVVHGIVSQAGGCIEVVSAPELGTTFRILLPAIATSDLVVQEFGTINQEVTGNELVLLVEDNDSVRQIARIALESHGYQVLDASRPGHALRLFDRMQSRISILVTDIVMPEMSGIQLADRIRQVAPDLPVVLLTGFTNDLEFSAAGGELANRIVEKPFLPVALARKIREALDASSSRNEENQN